MQKSSEDSQQHNSKWLTIEDFEYLCFDLARELLTFNEPIPDYTTSDRSLLESALGQPQQTFDQKLLYPTLPKQAAVLFYSLVKNHPFQNGNKRIGVMALFVFLALNGKWLDIKNDDLYMMACWVAESKPIEREDHLKGIESILSKTLKDL